MLEQKPEKQTCRLLKLLSRAPATGLVYEVSGSHGHLVHQTRRYRFPQDLVEAAAKKQLVEVTDGYIRITPQGNLVLRAWLNPESENPYRPSNNETVVLDAGGSKREVTRNMAESPLLRLFHRRTSNGTGYISIDEFSAGEKLRADFERGQLQPSVTASWTAMPVNARRGGEGATELSGFALDARDRVAKAVDFLGPELSGVALDVCCFLKGLEAVERERCWPPRSAKLMLKTGLAMLSRHYGLVHSAQSARRTMRHWGAAGYRPQLDPGVASGSSLRS